jgi:HD-GYP domain-containing protein (c-di-GMP phosphodiesterase class II)
MDFFPIRLGTLRPSVALPFDVYVPVAGHPVHYLKKKEEPDVERLSKLKAKGVKKLWIQPSDESVYLEYLDAGLGELSAPPKAGAVGAANQKAELAHGALVSIAEGAEQMVDSPQEYVASEVRVGKVVQFLRQEQGALRGMLGASGFSLDDTQHAANVASIALALAARHGIQDTKELTELGLAALLHDWGREGLGLPEGVKVADYSLEQRKLYEQHPVRAAEKIAEKNHIPKTVMELVLNHEERGECAGFPGKKRLVTLPLKQQILNLADEYDHLCSEEKLQPLEAVKTFLTSKVGYFDLSLIQSLGAILVRSG